MDQLIDVRAFTLGMLALLNPCGFALLPAYLGLFLSSEDDDGSADRGRLANTFLSLNRAQVVGLTMSAGFLAVFGLLGIVLAGVLGALQDVGALPYITVVMGVGLVALGIAMIVGYQPVVNGLKISKGGGRSLKGMFLFGVSYAVASIGCTIGLFGGVIGTSSANTSYVGQLGSFISYGLGMGLLATVLTLAVSLGRQGFVNWFRSSMGTILKVSAVILVIVGFYVAFYGIYSVQLFNPDLTPTPWIASIVQTAEGWQSSIYDWMNADVNFFGLLSTPMARTSLMGYIFLAINLVVWAGALMVRRSTKSVPATPAAPADTTSRELSGAK